MCVQAWISPRKTTIAVQVFPSGNESSGKVWRIHKATLPARDRRLYGYLSSGTGSTAAHGEQRAREPAQRVSNGSQRRYPPPRRQIGAPGRAPRRDSRPGTGSSLSARVGPCRPKCAPSPRPAARKRASALDSLHHWACVGGRALTPRRGFAAEADIFARLGVLQRFRQAQAGVNL